MKLWEAIKNNFLWLLIPAGVFMGPFLVFPAFNIIDDGASLLVAQNLSQDLSVSNWSQLLIEEQTGRFRPAYHLSFFIIYKLFGLNPFFFWLTQGLILGGTLIAMSIFLYRITRHYWISALSPLTLFLFTPLAENFYRLGTAEPKQFLLFGWLLVVLQSAKEKGWNLQKGLLWLMLFAIALLVKETSVLFLGLIVALSLWQSVIERKKNLDSWSITIIATSLCLGFLVFIPSSGSYSSGFQLVPQDIWLRFLMARLDYAALFFPVTLGVISLGTRFVYQLVITKKVIWDSYFWSLTLLSQLIAIFVIGILPWTYQLPRYYYPLYLLGILFVFTEGYSLLHTHGKIISKYKWWLATLVVLAAYLIQLIVFQSATGLVFNLNSLIYYFENYTVVFFVFILLIASSILRLSLSLLFNPKTPKVKLSDYFSAIWFIGAIVFVSVFAWSFWQQQWLRNLYLTNLLLAGYAISEVYAWLKLRSVPWFGHIKLGPALCLVMIVSLVVLFINHNFLNNKGVLLTPIFGNTTQKLVESFDVHQVSYALIRDLLTETPTNTQIYVDSSDYEVVFEIGLYASQLKQRPIVVFTSNQSLVNDLAADYPYLHYSENPVIDFMQATAPKQLLLRKGSWSSLLAQDSDQWQQYQSQEKNPAASLGSIPTTAHWIIISQ